jgi:hypothetical protein
VGGGEVGGRLAVTGVVSDASPLIALHQIEQLGLLGTIFGTVLIPPAVASEARTVERPSWILERDSAVGPGGRACGSRAGGE